MAAGLTSVPKKRGYNAYNKGSRSSGERGGGEGGVGYESEPEFGWQQSKPRGRAGGGAIGRSMASASGGRGSASSSGGIGIGKEGDLEGGAVEGFGGGWRGSDGDEMLGEGEGAGYAGVGEEEGEEEEEGGGDWGRRINERDHYQ